MTLAFELGGTQERRMPSPVWVAITQHLESQIFWDLYTDWDLYTISSLASRAFRLRLNNPMVCLVLQFADGRS